MWLLKCYLVNGWLTIVSVKSSGSVNVMIFSGFVTVKVLIVSGTVTDGISEYKCC